jgi:hypothetical protein
MSEFHHVQFMVHEVQRQQREVWEQAQRRAHIREALREQRAVRPHTLRKRVSVLICRWSRRSSAPCWDASVRPVP